MKPRSDIEPEIDSIVQNDRDGGWRWFNSGFVLFCFFDRQERMLLSLLIVTMRSNACDLDVVRAVFLHEFVCCSLEVTSLLMVDV